MNLTDRCRVRLKGVHPHLVAVLESTALPEGITSVIVTEGLRTAARQAELVKAGASQTNNSRHLTGHAVDLAVLVGSEVRWDWPLYVRLGQAVKQAAQRLGVALVWGGDWKTLRDGPHFELHRNAYPA